jgi:pentatricopeptide repeat protein
MIKAYSNEYKLNKALAVFNRLKESSNQNKNVDKKFLLDEKIYEVILQTAVRCRNLPCTEKLLEEMKELKIQS